MNSYEEKRLQIKELEDLEISEMTIEEQLARAICQRNLLEQIIQDISDLVGEQIHLHKKAKEEDNEEIPTEIKLLRKALRILEEEHLDPEEFDKPVSAPAIAEAVSDYCSPVTDYYGHRDNSESEMINYFQLFNSYALEGINYLHQDVDSRNTVTCSKCKQVVPRGQSMITRRGWKCHSCLPDKVKRWININVSY